MANAGKRMGAFPQVMQHSSMCIFQGQDKQVTVEVLVSMQGSTKDVAQRFRRRSWVRFHALSQRPVTVQYDIMHVHMHL